MAVIAEPLIEGLMRGVPDTSFDSAHCISGQLPDSSIIVDGSYHPNRPGNEMTFTPISARARVGAFDVRDSLTSARRAFLLFLPDGGSAPTDVLYGIMPPMWQRAAYWSSLNAHLPVSDAAVRDVASLVGLNDNRPGMVKAHYVQQVMTCKRRYALLMPIRSLSATPEAELGPFAANGRIIREAIDAIAATTGRAFSCQTIDAFGHSAGGEDLARLLAAVSVRHAIAIDPSPAARPSPCTGVAKYYVSGYVGGSVTRTGGQAVPIAGAEHIPYGRWRHEPTRGRVIQANFGGNENRYLHDWAFPRYLLRLGLQAT